MMKGPCGGKVSRTSPSKSSQVPPHSFLAFPFFQLTFFFLCHRHSESIHIVCPAEGKQARFPPGDEERPVQGILPELPDLVEDRIPGGQGERWRFWSLYGCQYQQRWPSDPGARFQEICIYTEWCWRGLRKLEGMKKKHFSSPTHIHKSFFHFAFCFWDYYFSLFFTIKYTLLLMPVA